jgi:hypothetical protein
VTGAGLRRAIATAVDARARLHDRTPADVARALALAGRRFAADETLPVRLAESSGLHPSMLRTVLPLVASMLDEEALGALLARERGEAAAPEWIAHALASNVPALAVPAIALGCLAGAAVVVKSGHRDTVSAAAFQRALAAVDAPLAATVVPVAWGHSPALDDVLLDTPLAVLTGHDETVAMLAGRATGRVLAHGTRYSALLLDTRQPLDPEAVARDVVLYEQRGCLSPHVAFVVGDAERCAADLAAALRELASTLPPATSTVEDRAGVRLFLEEVAWRGARVTADSWGAVLLEATAAFEPTCGARTIRVVPIADAAALPALLPQDRVECVGTNAAAPDGLRERGVSRVCPVGRMQAPKLSWPRGQRPPLRSLLEDSSDRVMEIELRVMEIEP